MMRSVYLKTLYDKRFFMLGWGVGFAALAALMTSFYPAMHQEGTIDALVSSMPPAFKGLVGNLADLTTFPTYLGSQLFDIRIPLIAGVMSIILGLGLSVAEEERGELRTITSLPISRSSLLLQKWFAMVTVMLVTLLGLTAGIYATVPFVEGADIGPDAVMRLIAMTGLVMVTYGTIPFAVGMASGRRALASALAILAIIGSFLLSTFGQTVEWLEPYEKLSLLHYFPAVDIVKGTIELRVVAVFACVTLALLVTAFVMFRRRDIA